MNRACRYDDRLKTMTVVLFLSGAPAAQAGLTTAQIVASGLSPACIQWRISGICYWLLCTPLGCRVITSVRVTHNLPDVVVSTYRVPGGNPWREMTPVSQMAGGLENALARSFTGLPAGGGNASKRKYPGWRHTNLLFRYADAVGHPATALIGNALPGYSCPGVATPLFPYFLSTLDTLAWRTGLPEAFFPEALIPGQRELGVSQRGDMWGALYPRGGLVNQTDGDKAAAVVAQRVADILTRPGQPHVYRPLRGTPHPGYWPPGAVTENTGGHNHTWQRLSPVLSTTCAGFPDGHHEAASDGSAAFALWRPYSCCQRRGQTLLFSTQF